MKNREEQLEEEPQRKASVRRLPLTHQVAAAIRDMVIQDDLKPGERVRERELSELLNVSRTPLREALKILAAEGLLELHPNRGAIVADPEPEQVRDRLALLGVLEGLAGEWAAKRASDEEITEIRALHFEMLAAYSRQDRLTYFKLNQAIHAAIVKASRSKDVIELHGRINAQLYRVRYRSNLKNQKWHTAIEEHEAILKALEARDAERLGTILRNHLGSTWAKVNADGLKSPIE
ncbi:GntR family transcriptional regulator [Limibacillus halophilus]|jgi:DNA-binding GntR family transcriptional regulator